MRTIDADYLKEHLCAKALNYRSSHQMYTELVELLDAIDEVPTVEPERKKGEWIPVDSYSAYGGDLDTWEACGNPIAFHYCSVCKEQAYADEEGKDILSDFCPTCGSYNGGENEN